MTPKLWLAVAGGVFLLVAAYMFGTEGAQELFNTLTSVLGET